MTWRRVLHYLWGHRDSGTVPVTWSQGQREGPPGLTEHAKWAMALWQLPWPESDHTHCSQCPDPSLASTSAALRSCRHLLRRLADSTLTLTRRSEPLSSSQQQGPVSSPEGPVASRGAPFPWYLLQIALKRSVPPADALFWLLASPGQLSSRCHGVAMPCPLHFLFLPHSQPAYSSVRTEQNVQVSMSASQGTSDSPLQNSPPTRQRGHLKAPRGPCPSPKGPHRLFSSPRSSDSGQDTQSPPDTELPWVLAA